MAESTHTDLIALLARYAAEGILETRQALSAIQTLSAAVVGPEPGVASLLEGLVRHRDSVEEPDPASMP